MNLFRKIRKKWNRDKEDLRWLIRQGKGIKRYVLGFLAISFVSMAFALASPVASKYVVDSVTGPHPEFRMEYVALMLGTSIFSILLGSLSTIFSSYVNEKFSFSVRAKMFDRTQRGFWDKITAYHSGDMMARLNGDVEVIANNLIGILPSLIVTSLQLVIILIIVLRTDPVLALIGLIAGPFGLFVSYVFKKPFQKYQLLLRESQSEYYTFFQENLSNIGVVKAFQTEDRNNLRFKEICDRRLKMVLKSARIRAAMSAATKLTYGVAYVLAFAWCAHQLQTNPVYTYGTMTLFLSLVSQLQSAVNSLGGIIPQVFTTVVCARRVREITEQGEESGDPTGAVPERVGVRLEHVSFTYDNETVLKDISFEIPPLSHVGIIGSSGAGKTTLIRMLLALILPDSGTVQYLPEGDPAELASPRTRRLLTYVPQGNTLMTGTVRSNLLTGDADADEDKMWNALELAGAAEFVRSDPKGLDMPITERSGGISAGQAQRIGIARALMRDKPIIIFDEATSALDEATERRIFERLIATSKKTCFIITHRSTMLRYCDMVLEVNDDGHIVCRNLKGQAE